MRIFEPSRVNGVGYILVGGASSRFGKDKALVEFGGITMIDRMRNLLLAIYMPEIYLIGDPLKYAVTGLECVPDRWPGEGPLGGIITALLHTENRKRRRVAVLQVNQKQRPRNNFILSCDMPFLNEKWMQEFFFRALRSDADVVLPKSDSGLEPMCARWLTSARPVIEDQFNKGVRKVTKVFEHLKTEVLDEAAWKRFDSDNRLFWNMNTPEDYEHARRILETETYE
jgi:molybdopterin-guanine dinucleotide biosynthesis protein A